MDLPQNTVSKLRLLEHQELALEELLPGSVLYGDVGTGKTIAGLSYYKKYFNQRPLYVITTAKKRNEGDWIEESDLVGVTPVVIDSWNNIKNYLHVSNAFFIFDEQRAVGSGTWATTFTKIARQNRWIMLTGTPGDNWMDYIPLFIANGFYPNKTAFIEEHIEYDRFAKYPKVKRYHNVRKLQHYKENILVRMEMERHTVRHRRFIELDYDAEMYDFVLDEKWNPFTDKPVANPAVMTQIARRIVGQSEYKKRALSFYINTTPRVIVYYNYTYELEDIREICIENGVNFSEYNGSKHQDIPDTDEWVYIVQYTAGAEGWNCIDTDTVLLYSPNYSYKLTEQSEGRIDRLNTPFTHLQYVYLITKASIDNDIRNAIETKSKFNEKEWGSKRERKRVSRATNKKIKKAFSRFDCFEERS